MIHPAPKPKPRPKKGRKPIRRSRVRQKAPKRRFPGRENREALARIREMPCAVCLHVGEWQESRTEVEHWVTKARGGYDIGDTYPTCAKHRIWRHTLGDKSFAERIGISPRTLCEQTEAALDWADFTERYDRERSVG